MGKARTYASATAFRRALEDRLRRIAEDEGLPIERLRREVAFDRLLARLFAVKEAPWVLKGGYALELRVREARATRDIDLALREPMGAGRNLHDALFAALEKAVAADMADFFVFEVGALMRDLDAAPYGGGRFPVEARMDKRTFVEFHVDIGAGDVVLAPLDTTGGRDWLGFAGIPAARFPTISREQHFAEKVHAYTLPRTSPNSRVRDMVDMVLLITSSPRMDPARVRTSIEATFKRRKTHRMPARLEPPPDDWTQPYARLARQCGLPEDVATAFLRVAAYLTTVP